MLPLDDILKEVKWKTSRSGGKGGQNVNKVETKVELLWDIAESTHFTEEEKAKITTRLSSHISKQNILSVSCEVNRSQLKNKEAATKKFFSLLKKAFAEQKKRIPTKPSKGAIARIKTGKTIRALIKTSRKKVKLD